MFQRYKERARRVIFVARYEAVQFGSRTIETEHLLLGLIHQDKNLIKGFLGDHSLTEDIRSEIERLSTIREKVSHSIDIPLSDQSKRILAYAVGRSGPLQSSAHRNRTSVVGNASRRKVCGRADSQQARTSFEQDP